MGHVDDVVRLRMCRRLRQLGWTVAELSEATGHGYRNVCRWLRGDVRMPADFLTCFVGHVPVSVDWLVTGEGLPDPVAPLDAERALKQIADIIGSQWMPRSETVPVEWIVRESTDGIVAFDVKLRYTLWSPAMERMRCKPASRVLGKVVAEVFPFLEEAGVIGKLRRVLRGEAVSFRDHPYIVPGTQRTGHFDALYSPLRHEDGEIAGGFGVVHDTTPWEESTQQAL